MARRFKYRRVKIHRNYEIAELAALIGAHRQTICRWIAAGLSTTESRRPHLIRGIDFRAFMRAREPIKQHCQPGEFYCLGCRPETQWVAFAQPSAQDRGSNGANEAESLMLAQL